MSGNATIAERTMTESLQASVDAPRDSLFPHTNGRVSIWFHGVAAVGAGLALVASLIIVFVSVVSRYFFGHPLAWADDADTSMLVTIGFLGGALTLARGEHIGVAAIRQRMRGRLATTNDAFIAWIVLIVSVSLCYSSSIILQTISGQTTATGLPEAINYLPILVSSGFMIVFALFDLARHGIRPLIVSAVIIVALAALWEACTLALPSGSLSPVVLMLAGFAITLLLGVPIGFALALGALLFFWGGGTIPIALFSQQLESGISNVVLLAIPFFVIAGLIMEINGMSRRLIDLLLLGVGRFRGGLRVVMVLAMALFSGISGSKSADVVAVGSALIPAFRKAGQREDDAVALLAATAVMGETIPPCINMIILGYVANLSIGGLFIAGLLPAGVMAIGLLVVAVLTVPKARVALKSRRPTPSDSATDFAGVRRPRHLLSLIGGAVLTLFMLVIIFGGILGGIATPTEVSAFAVIYAFVVGGLIFREMTVRSVASLFVRSASLAGMILFIVAAAQAVTYVLTAERIPQAMADALVSLSHSAGNWLFLLLCMAMLVVMGSVLEGAPALIIFGPLLIPIASQLGVNPLQFGILLIVAMGLGLFSPPFGVGLYTACAVGGVPIERVAKPMAKYLAVLVGALIVIAFVPWLCTALPNALGVGG